MPVVTSDLKAFQEVVRDGYNGYRFRSFEELKKALYTILLDEAKIKEMGSNNKRLGGRYRIEKVANEYLEVLS